MQGLRKWESQKLQVSSLVRFIGTEALEEGEPFGKVMGSVWGFGRCEASVEHTWNEVLIHSFIHCGAFPMCQARLALLVLSVQRGIQRPLLMLNHDLLSFYRWSSSVFRPSPEVYPPSEIRDQ